MRVSYPCCHSHSFTSIFHLAEDSKDEACSYFLGLLPLICRTRLSNVLFVFSSFTVFYCYFLARISLALRRIANEDTGDRGKVFVNTLRYLHCLSYTWIFCLEKNFKDLGMFVFFCLATFHFPSVWVAL